MAQIQILKFENRIKNIIINSCATCVSYYIDNLDLTKPHHILKIMNEKKFLKFFYDYLKVYSRDKATRNILKQRRFIKIEIHRLHEDIVQTIEAVERIRNT